MEEKDKKKLINQVKMVVRTEFPDFAFDEYNNKDFDGFIELAELMRKEATGYFGKFSFLWLVISLLYQAERVRVGKEDLRIVYENMSQKYWDKAENSIEKY